MTGDSKAVPSSFFPGASARRPLDRCPRGTRGPTALRVLASIAASALVLASLAACSPTPVSEMTNAEKASRVFELRRDAESALRRFRLSEDTDLAALEEYVQQAKETTELYPNAVRCPLCYRQYGIGLRLLGIYHWEARRALQASLASLPPSRVAEVEAEIRRHDELVKESFRESIHQLEAFLETGESSIDPEVWDAISAQYAELGEYRRALRYIQMLLGIEALPDADRAKLEGRRAEYRRQMERRDLERMRDGVDE